MNIIPHCAHKERQSFYAVSLLLHNVIRKRITEQHFAVHHMLVD